MSIRMGWSQLADDAATILIEHIQESCGGNVWWERSDVFGGIFYIVRYEIISQMPGVSWGNYQLNYAISIERLVEMAQMGMLDDIATACFVFRINREIKTLNLTLFDLVEGSL